MLCFDECCCYCGSFRSKTLTPDFCDITASSEYKPSTKSSGTAEIPKLSASKKIGKIVCDGAGLNAGVYYGLNRVSLRYGAALNAKTALLVKARQFRFLAIRQLRLRRLKMLKKATRFRLKRSGGHTLIPLPTLPL